MQAADPVSWIAALAMVNLGKANKEALTAWREAAAKCYAENKHAAQTSGTEQRLFV
jgi:hypothetical protein